jgi:hypothetical protein
MARAEVEDVDESWSPADDDPSRAEVLEDARLDRFASRRPGPPFHDIVRARQDEGRRGA